MRSKFKDEHPFEKRKAEAERIRQKYSDRIPVSISHFDDLAVTAFITNTSRRPQVICEKVEKSDIATIDKKKYLVPADLTVGQFVYVIRKRIKLSPEKAIFIFVDEVLPPTAALMSSIYEEHKDEDGYVTASVPIISTTVTRANMCTTTVSFTSHTRARTPSAISRLRNPYPLYHFVLDVVGVLGFIHNYWINDRVGGLCIMLFLLGLYP